MNINWQGYPAILTTMFINQEMAVAFCNIVYLSGLPLDPVHLFNLAPSLGLWLWDVLPPLNLMQLFARKTRPASLLHAYFPYKIPLHLSKSNNSNLFTCPSIS